MLLRTRFRRKKRRLYLNFRMWMNPSFEQRRTKADLLFLIDENNGVPLILGEPHVAKGATSWGFKGSLNGEEAFFKVPRYSRKASERVVISSFLRAHYSLERLTEGNNNVVGYYGPFDEKGWQFCLALEWLDGKNLWDYKEKDKKQFSLKEIIDLLTQTAKGLDYIHSKKIIHSDIGPSNIFWTKDGHLRIIDLGNSQRIGCDNFYFDEEEVIGTTGCIAPEIFLQNKYSFSSDIYSAGATFYYLLTGELPYLIKPSSSTAHEVLGDIREGDLNLEDAFFEEHPDFRQVLIKSVHKDVTQRYDCAGRLLEDLAYLVTQIK